MGLSLSNLTRALATLGCAALIGCSSSSSKLTCGAGTVQQGSQCVAASPDASVSADAAIDSAPEAEAASDAAGAPAFGGVTAVAPVSGTALLAVWNAAQDPSDPSASFGYRVYAAPSGQPLSYDTPVAQTLPGALSAVIGDLTPGTAYVVGARSVNAAGVEDENTVTLTGTPAADTTPPTFGGVLTASPGGSGAVTLTWKAAADDLTPAAAIEYLVFMSTTPSGEDFSQPALVTDPGATSATVTHLANASETRYFAVLARDAAGNVTAANGAPEVSSTPGPDTVPPVFGGCTAAVNVSSVTVAVAWLPATDDVSQPAQIKYEVLASTTPGDLSSFSSLATATGQDEVVLPALMPATQYYFICRAVDEAGNVDANAVEVTATTGSNPTPPAFSANLTITPGSVPFTATISWDQQATDNLTPPDQIVYDVFESMTSMGEPVTGVPTWSSQAGATSVTLQNPNLTANTTLYFAVCARDADGNHGCDQEADAGLAEVSISTPVSFTQNVAPILTHDCGVVGCHVPGNPTGALILADGFAYQQIVNVTAPEAASLLLVDGGPPLPNGMMPTFNDGGTFALDYVTPGDYADSFLYVKTHQAALTAVGASITGKLGSLMPAPATGSTLSQAELDAIQNWIAQGALNN